LHHKILVDESVDYRLVKKLRTEGFDIISVLEKHRSIKDKAVLELAKKHNAVLLTEDSDFGEWVFSHKEKSVGVIFLRYKPIDIEKISHSLVHILNTYKDTLANKFAVIKVNKIRIRDI